MWFGMFIVFFYGILNLDMNVLCYVCVGYEDMLFVCKGVFVLELL